MASRERKRNERRKRKTRTATTSPELGTQSRSSGDQGPNPGGHEPGDTGGEAEDVTGFVSKYRKRSEAENQAAREDLDPLEEGERPLVVTIGAILSALVAVAVFVAYIAGAEVEGEPPPIATVISSGAIFAAMAYGMWKARYWAVLGFQALNLIVLVLATLNLASAEGLLDAGSYIVVIAVAGTFFWFGVKAMARIQMPDRP